MNNLASHPDWLKRSMLLLGRSQRTVENIFGHGQFAESFVDFSGVHCFRNCQVEQLGYSTLPSNLGISGVMDGLYAFA